jgi:hypothetical protein
MGLWKAVCIDVGENSEEITPFLTVDDHEEH